MIEKLNELDTSLFLWLNSFNSPFWDKVMWVVSGKIEWVPLYAILLAIVIYKYRWKSIWIVLAIALLITLADQISTEVFKKGIERLRPSHNEEIRDIVHVVKDYSGNYYRGGFYGFVSSHAANSFAVATFFTLLFKRRWFTYSIFFWASLVSYSRIYLGVHYPGDIIGGAILGAVIALLVYLLLNFGIKKYYKTNNSIQDYAFR